MDLIPSGGNIWAQAFIGGVSSYMAGGKFGHGFVSAGLGAALGGKGGIVGAAVVGGTNAEISGGKFKNGAASAAFSYAIRWAANEIAAGGQFRSSKANTPDAAVERRINRLSRAERREYGGLTFTTTEGVHSTTLSSYSGDPDFADVWRSLDQVPDGATINGTWHSHHPGLEPMFTTADWQLNYDYAKNMNGLSDRGITIAIEGMYLGGALDGNIYYYRLGDYVAPPTPTMFKDIGPLAPLPDQIEPYTTIIGKWY